MRSFFLLLLLANLLLFAWQFTAIRDLVETPMATRAKQLSPERLRIIRDTSVRVPAPAESAPRADQPISGTKS